MGAINFINTNPVADQMDAARRQHTQDMLAEDQDFRQRAQFEQGYNESRDMGKAFSDYMAQQSLNGEPASGGRFNPAPTPSPAAATVGAVPAKVPPTKDYSIFTGETPQPTPAPAPAPSADVEFQPANPTRQNAGLNFQNMTPDQVQKVIALIPNPADKQRATAAFEQYQQSQQAPVPAPAPTAAPVVPQTPTAIRSISNDNPRQSMMQIVAKYPSLGKQGFQMAQAQASYEVEQQNKAADRVHEYWKIGTPEAIAMSQEIARNAGLQIPDKLFTDARARAQILGQADALSKAFGQENMPAITAAMKNAPPGVDPMTWAVQNFTPVSKKLGIHDTAQGVVTYDQFGNVNPVMINGEPAMPFNHWKNGVGGANGGGVEQWKYQMWQQTNPNGSYEDFRKFATGAHGDQRARLIMGALRVKDGNGDPLYPNQAAAAAAVDQALGATPAPAAAPATPKPSTPFNPDAFIKK